MSNIRDKIIHWQPQLIYVHLVTFSYEHGRQLSVLRCLQCSLQAFVFRWRVLCWRDTDCTDPPYTLFSLERLPPTSSATTASSFLLCRTHDLATGKDLFHKSNFQPAQIVTSNYSNKWFHGVTHLNSLTVNTAPLGKSAQTTRQDSM